MLALAETYHCAGHSENAREAARQTLEQARQSSWRSIEAHALWLLAEVDTASERLEVAEVLARYCESLTLATDLGMRPLVAHCHLGLGKLYRRTGKRDEAHEHLTTATAMYREMDMRFSLEQAEVDRDT
jgi:thioredoxin-like negative regulator of GroEL